jgi:phosphoribosylaminoimidazolecarboxamide formyltransferase/IMP cyclohydrolase
MAIKAVRTVDERVRVRTVLASVSDKSGLEILVPGLIAACPDISILSTGGTYDAIRALLGAKSVDCLRQVSEYTGQPEMQGGLVKTLDWRIYLGLLSETYNPAHRADMAMHSALDIDMVVVNLYPFQKTVARPGATSEDARGNIDIGGPCMVRAAAKNFHRIAVVTDPADYPGVVAELAAGGGILALATRFALAQKAFRLTAQYDSAIASYLANLDARAMAAVYEVR